MSGSDLRRSAAPALVGALLFLVACALPRIGLYTAEQPADVALYQEYGEQFLDGRIPYRDFSVEYPPGALPTFVAPALGSSEGFTHRFKLLIAVCGAATAALVAVALVAAGATRRHTWLATTYAALAPLALGPTVLNRYDLWPTLLVAVALALLVLERWRASFVLLALAIVAKLYALVLLPLALVRLHERAGARAVRTALVLAAATAAAVVAPFLALGPGGIRFSVLQLVRRPLQVESLGGSIVGALDRLQLVAATVRTDFGSQNPAGSAARPVLVLTSLLLVLGLAAVWWLYARGDRGRLRTLHAAAAAGAVFVALGKVLSPQFLIWLVPLVPLVPGAVGAAAGTLLLSALALTRGWFPEHYDDVARLGGFTWLVLGRNLLLLALAVLLVAALRGARAGPRNT